MPTLEVEFEIFCSCGHTNLSNQSAVENGKTGQIIIVEPCEKCLKSIENDAWERGYRQGVKE